MYCSPKNEFNQREQSCYAKNEDEALGACSEECKFYKDCKKELNLGEDWKFPIWKEEKPTISDYLIGRYHLIHHRLKRQPFVRRKGLKYNLKKQWYEAKVHNLYK
jgi:hypothetical protein